jgi:hypothetical protein
MLMRRFAFFAMVLLGGCATSTEVALNDAGRCGPVTCDEGLVCCNESCGICTLPGAGCPAIECEDPTAPRCDAMDATPVGACDLHLGIAFDGDECVSLSGCSCEGEDCDSLFMSPIECENACAISEEGDSCGGITGAFCSPGFYCEFDPDAACVGGGACRAFDPADCVDPPGMVCGCDGEQYASVCEARVSGTDILDFGPCDAI